MVNKYIPCTMRKEIQLGSHFGALENTNKWQIQGKFVSPSLSINWIFPGSRWYKLNVDNLNVYDKDLASCDGVIKDYSSSWEIESCQDISSDFFLLSELWGFVSSLHLARDTNIKKL